MNTITQFFYFILLALMVSMLGGCATASATKSEHEIYYPKLPPGINTIEEAKQDLATLLKEVYTIQYDRAICEYPAGEKAGQKLGNKYPRMSLWQISLYDTFWVIYKKTGGTIDVYDDRIDFPFLPLYYRELSGDVTIQVRHGFVAISNHVGLGVADKGVAHKIADALYFIQKNIGKYDDMKMEVFKEKAAQYRALKTKPPVSEQQREYIVQANALTQRKDYAGAIDLSLKALDLDPVSYPGAYFNLALLSAQQNHFKSAIDYMKQYLMLVPDAPDARGAQDKIYEWKLMIQK